MICSVGLTCVDIVSFLPSYPLEDSDQRLSHNIILTSGGQEILLETEIYNFATWLTFRCTNQSWERGGNASNNSTVFACLGASVEYFGTLADDNLLR